MKNRIRLIEAVGFVKKSKDKIDANGDEDDSNTKNEPLNLKEGDEVEARYKGIMIMIVIMLQSISNVFVCYTLV